MSIHETIIKRVVATALVEGRLPCDLFGTKHEIEALAEALYTTRQFDVAIRSESADLKEVNRLLVAKRSAASRFRLAFGYRWPA